MRQHVFGGIFFQLKFDSFSQKNVLSHRQIFIIKVLTIGGLPTDFFLSILLLNLQLRKIIESLKVKLFFMFSLVETGK